VLGNCGRPASKARRLRTASILRDIYEKMNSRRGLSQFFILRRPDQGKAIQIAGNALVALRTVRGILGQYGEYQLKQRSYEIPLQYRRRLLLEIGNRQLIAVIVIRRCKSRRPQACVTSPQVGREATRFLVLSHPLQPALVAEGSVRRWKCIQYSLLY